MQQQQQQQFGQQIIDVGGMHVSSNGHSCGYCKNKEGSYTYGFQIEKMDPDVYKYMMEFGWRRCGNYFYKPDLYKSCCKSYTIRSNVEKYEMRKSHKKHLKKWDNFLYDKENQNEISLEKQQKQNESKEKSINRINYSVQDDNQVKLKEKIIQLAHQLQNNHQQISSSFNSQKVIENTKVLPAKNLKDYFTNYLMLVFSKQNQQLQQNIPVLKQIFEQSIPEYDIQINSNGQINFKVKEIPQEKPPQKQVDQQNKKIKKEKTEQTQQKTDNQEINSEEQKKNQDQNQKQNNKYEDKYTSNEIRKGKLLIKIQLAKADNTNFELYKNYCREIHDKAKEEFQSYQDFLCLQTLNFKMQQSIIDKNQKLLLGCFHMNYFIDNKLIAVGVIDMCFNGLSSVYFFYDPSFKKYNLGTIASLYEIEYIQYMKQFFPQFKYYYLGFYISDCQKMSYKAEFGPNELLCPRTYQFVEFDQKIEEKILKKPSDPSLSDENAPLNPNLLLDIQAKQFVTQNTKCRLQGSDIPLKAFLQCFRPIVYQIIEGLAKVIDKTVYPYFVFEYK